MNIGSDSEDVTSKIPALELLIKLGYEFIAPDATKKLRSDHSVGSQKATTQVMLLTVMREFLAKQTFDHAGKRRKLADESISKIITDLMPAMNLRLLRANEKLYDNLLYGVTVTEFIDGKKASPTIRLIDWENPENNYFHVTEEFVVLNARATSTCRPDIVCFVNGLPLVVIEAKKGDSDKPGVSTCETAITQQIRNQRQRDIPHLFAYSQLLLAVNGHDGFYGTCGTKKKFWAQWKEKTITEDTFSKLKNKPLTEAQLEQLFAHRRTEDKQQYLDRMSSGEFVVTDQDRLIASLLRKDRLLEMTRLYTFFDKKKGKIVARHQQVFGIQATIERITKYKSTGSREGGVFWHTTGSGKSFTMVLLARALIWDKALAKCRLVMVTDRVDLEDQLSRTFASSGALSDRDKKTAKASSGEDLAQQIGKGNQRLVFAIINKFRSAIKFPDCFNDSPDIIVLVDEGHRSQNGENNIRMQQMLPKAAYIAYTGTPLLKDDKTENKFGNIIHAYPMQEAVDDNAVTQLLYEERVPELDINERAIDAWFARMTEGLSSKQLSDLKRKYAQKGEVYQSLGRIELIAWDIYDHFLNFKHRGLRGQLACDSKSSAIRYHQALEQINKGKSADKQVTSAVVISAPDTREGHEEVDKESKDLVQNWWQENVGDQSEKAYTKAVIAAFEGKSEESDEESLDDEEREAAPRALESGPDILIVVDKLLTGFDEPKNTVLYIDKSLKSHNLIQAVARVNRLHQHKPFGYLIDYRGILHELDVTIEQYQALAKRTQEGFDIEDLKGLYYRMEVEYKKLPRLNKAVWQIFDEVKNHHDLAAMRQLLAPKIQLIGDKPIDINQKKRDDFDSALKAFSACMKVALQSASYFNDSSFDNKRDKYKSDLKYFVALRKMVREDADESVRYDDYAEDIKNLLDKHIAGVEIKTGEGAYLVNDLGNRDDPQLWSDDEARRQKAAVSGRVTRIIEQELTDDPYAQVYFSNMLKRAIEETKAMFDTPIKQYLVYADLENKVKARKLPDLPPSLSATSGNLNKQVQAYFGLFKHLFDAEFLTGAQLDDDKLAAYAFDVDATVRNAFAEYSIVPTEFENVVENKLLTMLYADLGVNNAKKYSEAVLKITRLALNRG